MLSLAACGTQSGQTAADSQDPTTAKLLAAADAAAKSDDGEAKHVEAVKATRGKAADLTGHSSDNQDEVVWVVQVSGDHYTCGACSVPAGAHAPSGDYLTLVLRASDLMGTDGGIGPKATDLSALGKVEVLRD